MNDAQALEILKQFIDQAIGQGLFKSYEMATTAVAAVDRLRISVQEKEKLLALPKANGHAAGQPESPAGKKK